MIKSQRIALVAALAALSLALLGRYLRRSGGMDDEA